MAILDFSTTHAQVTDFVINAPDSTRVDLSHDIFYNKTGKLVTIFTGAGGTGTQLAVDTDFETKGETFPDSSLPTSISPDVAYVSVAITNAMYHNTDLYVSFYPIGDVINAEKWNDLDDRAAEVYNVTLTASTSSTLAIDDDYTIGKRILIRRLGAYDETNTNKLTINFSGGEVCTPEQLSSIELYGDGGNWLIEKVTATRWEIVAGWDAGENDDGRWERKADGAMSAYNATVYTGEITNEWGSLFTSTQIELGNLPLEFSSIDGRTVNRLEGSEGLLTIIADRGGVSTTSFGRTTLARGASWPSEATGDFTISCKAYGRWYELV